MVVSQVTISLGGVEQGGMDLSPYLAATVEVDLHEGDLNVVLLDEE